MKTRVSLFIFCIQMIAVCGFAADRRIDGNGNPETREIKISDYDEITFVGSADFEYEQSDKAPYLSVTIDENLFDYLVTEVEGGTLKIYPKSTPARSRSRTRACCFSTSCRNSGATPSRPCASRLRTGRSPSPACRARRRSRASSCSCAR